MSFGPECSLDYIVNLQMPLIDILYFMGITLKEKKLLEVVLWATRVKIRQEIR